MAQKVTQDITAIANYAGTYSKDLISQMLNALDIAVDIYVLRNVKADKKLVKLTVTAGIRPLDTSVDDVDETGRVWSGRTISVKGGMKLFHVIPEELRDTFFSEQLSPNAKEVPFSDWVWAREFDKVAQEINDSVFYADYKADAAAFNPATAYTIGSYVNFEKSIYVALEVTTAGQSPVTHEAKWEKVNAASIVTGIGTIIKNEITAGNLVPIATSVISSTNAVAELRKVWLAAPVSFRKKKSIMYISYDVYEKYKADYDTRYGKGNSIADNTEDQEVIYLKGTSKKVELKPCTWMNDSQRIILTLPNNLVMATDQLSDTNSIGKIVETLHGFKAILKYLMGFQIQDLEVLFVNDKV